MTQTTQTTRPVVRPVRHVDPTRRQQAVAAWVLAVPFVLLSRRERAHADVVVGEKT